MSKTSSSKKSRQAPKPESGSGDDGSAQPHDAAFAAARSGRQALEQLITAAESYTAQGRRDRCIALYRCWLDNTESPLAYAVNFNLGVALANDGDFAAAEAVYRQCLALKPDFIQAYLNLGTQLERRGEVDAALAQWRHVLTLDNLDLPANKPLQVHALNNLGRVLETRKQLRESEQMLTESLTLDPQQPDALLHWVHLRQKQCEWPVFAPFAGITRSAMATAASCLAMLSASNDPAAQLATARRFVASKVVTDVAPISDKAGYDHARLRVAYLSSDFLSHAVSILTVEMFELHDRARVEVYAFSWSKDDGTPFRARIVNAFDHYVRIADMSDEDAARCIRSHEIDILVDLHGLTSGTRPNILCYRPAPVQITYLGFPGTTALPSIDYVLADKFVLPEELAPYFTEQPLYMPQVFQVNDRQRKIGARPTRAACNLPEGKFVFCSFNSNYKFNPEVFAVWMRILQRVADSVLWLVADNEWAQENLCRTAEQLGVDRGRLIFATRVPPADYLARFQVADLFLDTFPFNAGTTASDALWAGLPLVTCVGRTFASRMAGSLLHAVGLPDLITSTLRDYEEKAVSLAQNPQRVEQLKRQLAAVRLSCPLFDTPQFVMDLENLYERVASRPAGRMKQTPINEVTNVDVLNFMSTGLAHVVEVGSSSGALARAYRQGNPQCRYEGIEIVEEYAEASRQHCSNVVFGDVEKLPDALFRKLATADCWVFADSLEHLYDPWKLLARIRSDATGPVEIVACIPNAQHWALQSCLNGGKFCYQDDGLLDRTHIRWFTRLTILDMFQSAGYRIVNMISRSFNRPPPPVAAAIRQLAVAFGSDPDQAEQDALPHQYVVKAVADV